MGKDNKAPPKIYGEAEKAPIDADLIYILPVGDLDSLVTDVEVEVSSTRFDLPLSSLVLPKYSPTLTSCSSSFLRFLSHPLNSGLDTLTLTNTITTSTTEREEDGSTRSLEDSTELSSNSSLLRLLSSPSSLALD